MKSTIFRKVINEEYIEVNKSVFETIKCLCEQSGESYNETPDGMNIHFECLKNGKCYVRCGSNEGRSTKSMYQMYYVYGEVVSKDDKTYVKILSVYEKADFLMRIISSVLAFLFLPVYLIYQLIKGQFFLPATLAGFAVLIVLAIDLIRSTSIRKNNHKEIIEILENEIKKRIKNIERWDD